jgi:hypothetical protein
MKGAAMAEPIDEETKMAVFFQVVSAEDAGVASSDARRQAAEQFGLTLEEVRDIEEEGIENSWPPLEPCDEEDE